MTNKLALKEQPHISKRKRQVYNTVKKYPNKSLKELTKIFLKEHEKINYKSLSPDEFDNQLNKIRYILNKLNKDELIIFKEIGAERGAWMKKIWKVK